MKSVAVVVAMLAVMVLGEVARAEVKQGDHFTELDAVTAKGKKFRLKAMAGKWVLYTFGASWCQPCHKELPAYDRIAPKLTGKVLFVAINIDEKVKDGQDFLDSLKLHHLFPVFMSDGSSAALKAYDPDHMPSTFVIDPTGVVRLVHYGFEPGDEDKLVTTLIDLTK